MARLHGAPVDRRPFQESDSKSVLAAADFRIQRTVVRQGNPQQSATRVFLHLVMIHAVYRDLLRRLRAFAHEP
jgi:hypothetical protein